jgi:ubiquitin-protein ligase
MGSRTSTLGSSVTSRRKRLNALLAMYDRSKPPLDNLRKILIILVQEFYNATQIDLGNTLGISASASTVKFAPAAAAAEAPKAAAVTAVNERGVQKIAGFGYSGNVDDAKRRKILITQKHLERFQMDQSIVNCVQAVMHVLNAHHTDKDVIELWNNCSVFNSVAYHFLQEAPASQMIEERWVIFQPILQACQRIATRPHLRQSLVSPNNLVSLIADVKKQLELMDQLTNKKDSSVNESDFCRVAIASCQFVLDQVAGETNDQKSIEASGEHSWLEERRSVLRDRKLEFVDLTGVPFIFESEFAASANEQPSKARLGRIRKEISNMQRAIPDGVFVRIDQDRFDKMKVMIAGPVDTPYENGLLIFDVFLPPEYPSVPPKMKICTTGGGQFRFNPNLYTNGKVCLSLLGTWSGPGWDPTESTILQLLISVQAMILVEFPYENEPGYENQRLSKTSLSYNCGIRHATVLYAMSWMLDKNSSHAAPACFQDVIDAHFIINRERILKQLDLWQLAIEENHGADNNYFHWTSLFPNGAWKKNRAILETQLAKLVSESIQ